MIRRRLAILSLLALVASCKVPCSAPCPPPPNPVHAHSIVVHVFDGDPAGDQPIGGASVTVDVKTAGIADNTGTVTMGPFPDGAHTACVQAEGFHQGCSDFTLASDRQVVTVSLQAALPSPPTRDEMLAVQLSFQGLTVQTQQFGSLPWFEAALPWLSPADRRAAYAAKHAAGDTHALVFLPSGPPLYDEPNQPYSADRFGPLDWTNGGKVVDSRLADLIVDLALHGFSKDLLFLGGDGPTGFPIGMAQLDLVHDALEHSSYGDLRGYVAVIPGWDSVFYGWTPAQIAQWGAKCRSLFTYCGIEHSTGHIPVGNGPADYAADGAMANFDLLLGEFDFERIDDTIWQVLARTIGPLYHRGPEQPANDDTSPPFYLKPGTPRGPYGYVCFESGEYQWVRGMSLARIHAFQNYLRARGCAYVN